MSAGSTKCLTDGFASASLATSSVDVPVPDEDQHAADLRALGTAMNGVLDP
jgi:hypothetical protein